jgi:hypothetical protein
MSALELFDLGCGRPKPSTVSLEAESCLQPVINGLRIIHITSWIGSDD